MFSPVAGQDGGLLQEIPAQAGRRAIHRLSRETKQEPVGRWPSSGVHGSETGIGMVRMHAVRAPRLLPSGVCND